MRAVITSGKAATGGTSEMEQQLGQRSRDSHQKCRRCLMMMTISCNTIFVIFILFITNCSSVSGSTDLSQYSLNDSLCDAWIEDSSNQTERCDLINKTAYCFGDLEFSKMNISITQMKRTEALYICGFMKPAFDANSLLLHFRKLQYLRIANSNFTHINNDFPGINVSVINITHTELAYTRPSLFEKLKGLKILDLRLNKLDHMEGPLIINDNFQAMYLSGNKWNCTRNMKWLLKFEGQKVADKDVMKCVDMKYTGRPLLTVMDFKQTIRSECQKEKDIRNCSCVLSYVRPSMNGEYLLPMYTVNCSNREFYHLPPVLPRNTTILHITHNKIRSLEPLAAMGNNYTKIQDLFIDYNQIKSIDILEGAPWLFKFRVLSLRGNKLTRLMYHVLDNALEKNRYAIELYLANNPWRCDCIFTPHFQDLLIKYKTVVKDANNITCKYLEGDKNSGLSVVQLNRGDVCVVTQQSTFLRPIDMLNIVLASLIIFIFAKLGYDYYIYKKYSKLPWFVTKLP